MKGRHSRAKAEAYGRSKHRTHRLASLLQTFIDALPASTLELESAAAKRAQNGLAVVS